MAKREIDPASVLGTLKGEMRSVLLATLGENGEPLCGYTPFIFDNEPDTDHHLIIFVSQLALHTRDLLSTGKVSAMLITDESESEQMFARTRVRYQCRAERITSDSHRYDALLDGMQARHGKLIGLLKTFPDFVLFRLVPFHGQLVLGFGQAYKLTGEKFDQFEHVRTA